MQPISVLSVEVLVALIANEFTGEQMKEIAEMLWERADNE